MCFYHNYSIKNTNYKIHNTKYLQEMNQTLLSPKPRSWPSLAPPHSSILDLGVSLPGGQPLFTVVTVEEEQSVLVGPVLQLLQVGRPHSRLKKLQEIPVHVALVVFP